MSAHRETDVLRHFLRAYCDVNALDPDWRGHLARTIHDLTQPDRARAFKSQLAAAIVHGTLSIAEYARETQGDFDAESELRQELRALWDAIYPEEDPLHASG